MGTSDVLGAFHPYCIGLVSSERCGDFEFILNELKAALLQEFNFIYNPTVLVCDAAKAISDAFKKSFTGNKTVIICFFHVMFNVKNRLASIKNNKMKNEIMEDISIIQRSYDYYMFMNAFTLFEQKWIGVSSVIRTFIVYFKNNWVLKNCNWYHGSNIDAPKTNNSLESTNNRIKSDFTSRTRTNLSEFLSILLNMAEYWSKIRFEGHINYKSFAKNVIIDKK